MALLITILFPWLLAAHPVHVSVTSIEIDNKKKEIFISHKLYTDDFSLLFYHLYEKNIMPERGQDFSASELGLINTYISAAFVLETGKTRLPIEFVRKDQDDQSTWLYYTGSLPSNKIRTLMLTNTMLLDLFEDQTNLVIVSDGFGEKGYTFNYKNWKMEISILRESASASEYIRAYAKNY